MRLTYSMDVSNATRRLEQMGVAFDDMSSGPMAAGFARAGTIYLASMRRRFVNAARGDGTWPDLADSTKLARRRGGKLKSLKSDLSKAQFLSESLDIRGKIGKERNRRRLDTLRIKLGRSRTGVDERNARSAIKRHLSKSFKDETATKKAGVIKSLELGTFEILRDTGLLLNSLTQGSPGNISNPLVDGIVLGTNVKYARHHQNPKIEGRPPTRKILVQPDPETRARIFSILEKASSETLKLIKA